MVCYLQLSSRGDDVIEYSRNAVLRGLDPVRLYTNCYYWFSLKTPQSLHIVSPHEEWSSTDRYPTPKSL